MTGRTGYFTVSFDFELIWGTLDLFGVEGFAATCAAERASVIDRTLELLATYRVPATWFVVGHLMLESCSGPRGHPDLVPPRHAWARGEWLARDPGGDERTAPLFFARSLVERILACPTPQEVGVHSFSHVVFGDPGCSPACAESELVASVAAARSLGVEPTSMAFPRNRVGHLGVLARYGIRSFRGPEPRWYLRRAVPFALARMAHLAEFLLPIAPSVQLPRRTPEGLWDVPGSMVYLPRHGIRRWIPVENRVRRAVRGLERAARDGGLFHLWMHPTNLADDAPAMLAGLDRIFTCAAELRETGRLRLASVDEMARIAAEAEARG